MDPTRLYSSSPAVAIENDSRNGNQSAGETKNQKMDSLKRKRSSQSKSRSKSNTPTPVPTPAPNEPSNFNSNSDSSSTDSNPTNQAPSLAPNSANTPVSVPVSHSQSLGPSSPSASASASASPAPVPVKGKSGWPKGKPRGPSNKSKTSASTSTSTSNSTSTSVSSNSKSASSSASKSKSKSKSTSQTAKEQASLAAQAQREAEAEARELEHKQNLQAQIDLESQSQKDSDDQVDTKLYCVCKTLYDENKMMIACDICDEWYHIECMNISERQAELIDMFICSICETETQKTTYKPPCLRSDCPRPALPPLSRYCSERCGLLMASERILKTKYAGKNAEEWGGLERLLESGRIQTARRKEGIVIWGDGNGNLNANTNANPSAGASGNASGNASGKGQDDGFESKRDQLWNHDDDEQKANQKKQDPNGNPNSNQEKVKEIVGQEWFSKFNDSWGNGDANFHSKSMRRNPHLASNPSSSGEEKQKEEEKSLLKEIRNLSLKVDGIDRNLLVNIFPISAGFTNDDTGTQEGVQAITPSDTAINTDTTSTGPTNFAEINASDFRLSAWHTKSQEEMMILRSKYVRLLKEKTKVISDLDCIGARYKLLHLVEDRLSNLKPVRISEESANPSSGSNQKKSKKSGKSKKDKEKEKEGKESNLNLNGTGPGTGTGATASNSNSEIKFTTGPPCGYDSRLNWDQERFLIWSKSKHGQEILNEEKELDGELKEDWEDVVVDHDQEDDDDLVKNNDGDGDGESGGGDGKAAAKESRLTQNVPFVCNVAKRKCKKHTDWSMVRGADFEVEKEIQTNLLSQLSVELSSLRERIHTLQETISTEKKSKLQELEKEKELKLKEKVQLDEDLARSLENEGKRRRG